MDDQLKTYPVSNFISVALGIIIIFLLVYVLSIGRPIILPFMIALFLSFLLDPLVNLLTKIKIPEGFAVLITLLVAFVVLYLLGMLVYANVENFVDAFPAYKERLLVNINAFSDKIEQLFQQDIELDIWDRIDWVSWLQSFSIARGFVNSVGTFFTFLGKMLLAIIFIAYFLTGKRHLNQKVERAFPGNQSGQIITILENVTSQVQTYLGTKTIISFITGVVSVIIFYIFGLDFAIFWGFIIFMFNFIPNIGSIIASVLPVLFSLLQFGSFTIALWLTLCMVILQIIMGNVVEPRMMGLSLNLSPMVVILSLIFWGYLWGVTGMILAVPILATLAIVCENVQALKFLSVFIRGRSSE